MNIVFGIIGISCIIHAGHQASLIDDDIGAGNWSRRMLAIAFKNALLCLLLFTLFGFMFVYTKVQRAHEHPAKHHRICTLNIENHMGELT